MIRCLAAICILALLPLGAGAQTEAPRFYWQEQGGWVDYRTVCRATAITSRADLDCEVNRVIMVPVENLLWAGMVRDLHFNPITREFDRLRLEVVLAGDRSPHPCGRILEVDVDDVRDFVGVSWAMDRCDPVRP